MNTWLALTVFCLPISIAASSLTLFPLAGAYLLGGRWTFRRWPLAWTPVESAFGVFWGLSLVSALFAQTHLANSADQLGEDLYALIIPLLGALLVNQSALRARLLKIFVWGGLVTATWGLLQGVLGIDQNELTNYTLVNVPGLLTEWPQSLLRKLSLNDGRATGLRSHPLTFAESLLFPLAILLGQLAFARVSWRKWILQMSVLLGGLLLSQSRGPWLAFGAMMLFLIVLAPRPFVWKRVLVLMSVPVLLIVLTPALRTRSLTIADSKFHSNSERLMMWKAGVNMIRDHPILGIGPGNVRQVSDRYQTPEQHAAFGTWGHLHNTYVHLAAERGLLGLAGFFLFIGTIGLRLARSYRSLRNAAGERSHLVLSALLGLMGWLVSGLTEALYNNSSIQMMFYFLMGTALAATRDWDY